MPAGVPRFMMFVINPVFFVQSSKEVLMIYAGDQQVRRIYLDVPHSENCRKSSEGRLRDRAQKESKPEAAE
jgi:hypothetical protein